MLTVDAENKGIGSEQESISDFISIDTPELQQLRESVFAPGNLIYGNTVSVPVLRFYLGSGGIQRAKELGAGQTLFSDFISLSMMSQDNLPERYQSQHHGPYPGDMPSSDGVLFSIAFIISRQKLLERFRNNIFAVGDAFTRQKRRRGERSQEDFSVANGKVFDIPIGIPQEGYEISPTRLTPYSDEIDLFAKENEVLGGIHTDAMLALVIVEEDLPLLRNMLRGMDMPRLFIFTPDCQKVAFIKGKEKVAA